MVDSTFFVYVCVCGGGGMCLSVCVCGYVCRLCLYMFVWLCVLMCDKLLDLFIFVFAIASIIIVLNTILFEHVYYKMGNKRVEKKCSANTVKWSANTVKCSAGYHQV